jgi:hypothetical protein
VIEPRGLERFGHDCSPWVRSPPEFLILAFAA